MAYLNFNEVSKSFPGVLALNRLSFSAMEGEVHALMGENGAGKSTLLKILGGFYQPSEGYVAINGRKLSLSSPSDAFKCGIAIIHQELQLVNELSVGENIFLGHMPHACGMVNFSSLHTLAGSFLKKVGLSIDSRKLVKELPIGERQLVEIAKALSRNAKIIAFDEPTSSLSDREVENLFKVIQELKSQGKVILYVSHRMSEIFAISDRITVLRDGSHVKTYTDLKEVTTDQLVRDMVGRSISDIYSYETRPLGKTILEVQGLRSHLAKKPLSMSVAQGEILGLFGLVGAGRSELLKTLMGVSPPLSGEVLVEGMPIKIRSPKSAIKAGFAFAPEDRKREGMIGIFSVAENLNLKARRNHLHAKFFLNSSWEKSHALTGIRDFRVKTPDADEIMLHLSGGNQQKVILAKWMSEKLKILLLDEPTRGIDVGAKNEIYRLIYQAAREGAGVILVSSDLSEVMGLSDRILVMREGEVTAAYLRADFSSDKILAHALPAAT